jgi:hypothetical protein
MIKVTRSEIPLYLRGSDWFKSLNEDDEDELAIPSEFYKENLDLHTAEELTHFLSTVRFWGVPGVPRKLIELTFSSRGIYVKEQLAKFGDELKYLALLCEIRDLPAEQTMRHAIRGGHLDIVQYLYEIDTRLPSDPLDIAAESGCLDILQFLYATLTSHNFTSRSCLLAARSGRVECLRFVHEHGRAREGQGGCNNLLTLRKVEWNGEEVCNITAREGFEECLKYALEQGARSYDATNLAAAGGHLPCLQLLDQFGCQKHRVACNYAAARGHLDCLKFLHEHGWDWSWITYVHAVEGNSFECFVYLHEQGCPWATAVAGAFAAGNSLRFLQYAVEHGCPLQASAVSRAANKGQLDCLVYLVEHGCPLTNTALSNAAGAGHLSCVQYLMSTQCPRAPANCAAAVRHLECLQYLHENACPWDSLTPCAAVTAGCLDALIYATTEGCPWYCAHLPLQCVCLAARTCTDPAILAYVEKTGCSCQKRAIGGTGAVVSYISRYS